MKIKKLIVKIVKVLAKLNIFVGGKMSYILEAFKIFPIALIITIIIYWAIYKRRKSKGEIVALSRVRMIAEFTLIGYFVMFIYVTQVLSFGNGMGEMINLSPMHSFYIAIKYGTNNAGMFSQFYLNVLMCVPLGILLPIVFPEKFRSFKSILVISFVQTFLTEVIQLLTGRSADIDDIIANTLGGLIGYTIFLIGYGIYYAIRLKKQDKIFKIKNYLLNIVISLMITLITISPLLVVQVLEGKQEFGYVYYGHLQPKKIEFDMDLSNKESKRVVYKIFENKTKDEVINKLRRITGFKGEFVESSYDNTLVCDEENGKAMFIYDHNAWSVDYHYGQDGIIDQAKLPAKEKSIEYALKYINQFEMEVENLKFFKFDEDYGDNAIHVIFEEIANDKNLKVWGNVEVTIGENGELMTISDNRKYFNTYKEVEAISQEEAVSVVKDVGVGEVDVTAHVTRISEDYYFEEEKGYLIPTWRIEGHWTETNNKKYEWKPNIGAIK
jgi:glycopeptide antibiotics resistance protein